MINVCAQHGVGWLSHISANVDINLEYIRFLVVCVAYLIGACCSTFVWLKRRRDFSKTTRLFSCLPVIWPIFTPFPTYLTRVVCHVTLFVLPYTTYLGGTHLIYGECVGVFGYRNGLWHLHGNSFCSRLCTQNRSGTIFGPRALFEHEFCRSGSADTLLMSIIFGVSIVRFSFLLFLFFVACSFFIKYCCWFLLNPAIM